MKQISAQVWMLIASIVAALAIIGSALWFKDTAYENAWLYIFCVWIVASPLMELYFKKKGKNK